MRNTIQSVFYKATNNYNYRWGILRVERLLKTNPRLIDENNLCMLGLLYDHLAMRQKSATRKRKYEAKALSFYRHALKINPNSPGAVWGIGRVWWHRKSKRAVDYALKAYRLAKKSKKDANAIALYAQQVGLVYENLRNYRMAEQWLLRGIKNKVRSFDPYLNLVIFYRLTNNFEKAKKYAQYAWKFYKNQPKAFRQTLWGRKIQETLMSADRPLPRVSKK